MRAMLDSSTTCHPESEMSRQSPTGLLRSEGARSLPLRWRALPDAPRCTWKQVAAAFSVRDFSATSPALRVRVLQARREMGRSRSSVSLISNMQCKTYMQPGRGWR